MIIRQCTISELEAAPNIHDLLAEYAEESSIAGLPTPAAQVETYRAIESSGALHIIAAFEGDLLIGYITVLSTVLPHYNEVVSVTESYFVSKEHRSSGAGLKLLRSAERFAREIGSLGLLVSAPTGGALSDVLPRVGYKETNRVFFRSLMNE